MLRLTKVPWVLGFDIYHIWFYDEKMLYDFSFYHIIIIFRSQLNFTSCVPFLPHPQPWTSNPDSDIPITIISQITFYSCNRKATRAGRSRGWGKGIERQEVIFPSGSKWEGEANAILMSSASPVILDWVEPVIPSEGGMVKREKCAMRRANTSVPCSMTECGQISWESSSLFLSTWMDSSVLKDTTHHFKYYFFLSFFKKIYLTKKSNFNPDNGFFFFFFWSSAWSIPKS